MFTVCSETYSWRSLFSLSFRPKSPATSTLSHSSIHEKTNLSSLFSTPTQNQIETKPFIPSRFCIFSMAQHLDLFVRWVSHQSRPYHHPHDGSVTKAFFWSPPNVFLTLPTPSCSAPPHPVWIQFIVSIPYLDTVTASHSITCLLLITLCTNQFPIKVSDISKIKVQTCLVSTWPTHVFMWFFLYQAQEFSRDLSCYFLQSDYASIDLSKWISPLCLWFS